MEKVELTKTQKILFIVLGIVLAYAIFDFITHKDTYESFYSGKKESTTAVVQNEKLQGQKEKDQLQTSLFSQWGSDPFLRQAEIKSKKHSRKKRRKPNFKLKAISYRPDGSVALINDRIVKVGDIIFTYKIIKIDVKQVILWNGKHRIVLKLTNM